MAMVGGLEGGRGYGRVVWESRLQGAGDHVLHCFVCFRDKIRGFTMRYQCDASLPLELIPTYNSSSYPLY